MTQQTSDTAPAAQALAPDLTIFHGPNRTRIQVTRGHGTAKDHSSRETYALTLAYALDQMHPDDRAALVRFAQDVVNLNRAMIACDALAAADADYTKAHQTSPLESSPDAAEALEH